MKKSVKRTSGFLSAVILLTTLGSPFLEGCHSTEDTVSSSGFFFDTIITITLYDTSDESYIDSCFDLARKYENLFSATVEGSDVWKINENAGEFVEVEEETVGLIQTGIDYGRLSEGKFDITLGSLSDLWNFSEIAENLDSEDNETDASVLPSDEQIALLLPHIDYTKISIDGCRVCLTDPQAKLDLGGIAKGYIADRMKEYLLDEGITSGFINLGGNVLTLKEKIDGSGYTIGIQKPFAESGVLLASVDVCDQTVVSSGVYERYYKVNGSLYHHILDLSTGYPYDNGLYEVTVICSNSVDGDALSTTCFALGLEDGLALIESLKDTEAIFVTSDGGLHTTSGIGTDIPMNIIESN